MKKITKQQNSNVKASASKKVKPSSFNFNSNNTESTKDKNIKIYDSIFESDDASNGKNIANKNEDIRIASERKISDQLKYNKKTEVSNKPSPDHKLLKRENSNHLKNFSNKRIILPKLDKAIQSKNHTNSNIITAPLISCNENKYRLKSVLTGIGSANIKTNERKGLFSGNSNKNNINRQRTKSSNIKHICFSAKSTITKIKNNISIEKKQIEQSTPREYKFDSNYKLPLINNNKFVFPQETSINHLSVIDLDENIYYYNEKKDQVNQLIPTKFNKYNNFINTKFSNIKFELNNTNSFKIEKSEIEDLFIPTQERDAFYYNNKNETIKLNSIDNIPNYTTTSINGKENEENNKLRLFNRSKSSQQNVNILLFNNNNNNNNLLNNPNSSSPKTNSLTIPNNSSSKTKSNNAYSSSSSGNNNKNLLFNSLSRYVNTKVSLYYNI